MFMKKKFIRQQTLHTKPIKPLLLCDYLHGLGNMNFKETFVPF